MSRDENESGSDLISCPSGRTSRASNKALKKDQTEKQGKAKTGEENGERRRASGLLRRGPPREAACKAHLQDPKSKVIQKVPNARIPNREFSSRTDPLLLFRMIGKG
jgi:hypothetical protein